MKAIFAGSFDPFTLGYQYVVELASKMFDYTYIVVADNDSKKEHMFSVY